VVVKLVLHSSGTTDQLALVTGAGFSAGNDYHVKLATTVSGTNYTGKVYITRASDGFYLKPDGSWQSGLIACCDATHDSFGLMPEPGNAGIHVFDFGSSSTGLQFDNFVLTAGGGAATAYAVTGASTANTNEVVTLTLTPDGDADGIAVTLDDGAAAGSFSVNPVTFSGSSAATTDYTCPSTAQTVTITYTNDGGLTDPADHDIVVSLAALSAGVLTAEASDNNVILSGTGPTGGAAPYARSLYRYTVPVFTPPGTGTLIDTSASSGTVTWTDTTAAFGVTYWYRELVEDDDSTTDVGDATVAVRWQPHRNVLLIGDSITADGQQFISLLSLERSARGPRQVTYVNQGQSSATAGSYLADHLSDAITNGDSSDCTVAYVMLGTNLSTNIPTYTSDMQDICDTLVLAGYTVYLFGPPYSSSLGDAWNTTMIQERGALASIANGSTVFWTDDGANALTASSYASGETPMLSDGVHYTTPGGARAGEAMFRAIDAILFPSGGGGTGGAVYMVGGDVVYNYIVAIAKSDTVNIVGPKELTDAVYVGGAGIVEIVLQNNRTAQITAVAGAILPIAIKRVNSGNTTATLMQAWYQV
jgi:hypothetical protein